MSAKTGGGGGKVADRTSYTGMEAPVLISDIPERTTVQKDSTYLLNVGEGNQYHDMHGPIIQGKVLASLRSACL